MLKEVVIQMCTLITATEKDTRKLHSIKNDNSNSDKHFYYATLLHILKCLYEESCIMRSCMVCTVHPVLLG
jgi:hypothetical protein